MHGHGTLDVQRFRDSLTDETVIVSAMWANNETGVIFPVEEMARIARERGILFHTDAVQAVRKIPLNLRDSAIDFLSLSGHKLHAPKGWALLYVRKGTPVCASEAQERGAARAARTRLDHRPGPGLRNWPRPRCGGEQRVRRPGSSNTAAHLRSQAC